MDKPIKISIITPSFNQGRYIENTIKSILEQNYLDLEYIVMDGGSEDETLGIINKYRHKITYWESAKDNGQVDAINKGIQRSSGDIVAWLNSDDIYKKGVLAQVAEYFESNPYVDILYGHSDIIDSEGKKVGEYLSESPSVRKWAYRGQIFVSQPSLFFRRTVFDVLGPLDETMPVNFDHDYWYRALIHGFTFVCANKFFSSLRWHKETISYNAIQKHRYYHLVMLRKHKLILASVFYYSRYILLIDLKKKMLGDIKLIPKRKKTGNQFYDGFEND